MTDAVLRRNAPVASVLRHPAAGRARRGAAGLGLALPLVVLTALVGLPDASASGPAARTPALTGASFSETWTTGQLPDAGGPIALSSPVPVTLGGQASAVVGDRHGNLFAFHLGGASATAPPGWPTTNESGPDRLDAVHRHRRRPDLGAGRLGQ